MTIAVGMTAVVVMAAVCFCKGRRRRDENRAVVGSRTTVPRWSGKSHLGEWMDELEMRLSAVLGRDRQRMEE